jgi:hypothetical protein
MASNAHLLFSIKGLWRGVLYLIVVAPNPGLRAYGIEMSCEIYSGIEEMIYSVADHGDNNWPLRRRSLH